MLATRLNLECDQCGNPFPRIGNCPAPVDGAIYTPSMLRAEAAADGWKRVIRRIDNDGSPVRIPSAKDFCPRCAKQLLKKGGK